MASGIDRRSPRIHSEMFHRQGLLREVLQAQDFRCQECLPAVSHECNYLGMAQHCRQSHVQITHNSSEERKTEFIVCQAKIVRYNLGVKTHHYHSKHWKHVSCIASPGISAVLQNTSSSMTPQTPPALS